MKLERLKAVTLPSNISSRKFCAYILACSYWPQVEYRGGGESHTYYNFFNSMVKTSRSEVLKVTYTVHIILILTLYKLQYQPLKVGKIFSTNHTYIKQLSICHLNSHKTSQLKKISARKIHEMTFFFLLRYFDYYNICHH